MYVFTVLFTIQFILTTNLLATFAATRPKAIIYNVGWFSYTFSTLFRQIMNAGITTSDKGITGDKTDVPYKPPQTKCKHFIKKTKFMH